jgi:hypothetical protein
MTRTSFMVGRSFFEFPDRLVASSARSVTRRRFLRNAGGAALGASLGVAYLSRSGPALAFGTADNPCGPSPLCVYTKCSGTPSNCNSSPPGNCSRRHYNDSSYPCTTEYNCWNEDYRSVGKGWWRCCDCCCDGVGGPNCSGCSGQPCICRSLIG